jgi:hypothetical protein
MKKIRLIILIISIFLSISAFTSCDVIMQILTETPSNQNNNKSKATDNSNKPKDRKTNDK